MNKTHTAPHIYIPVGLSSVQKQHNHTCMFTCDKSINTDVVCVPNNRLQMSVFTNADGFGLVPARLAVSPHDASEGRVSL